MTVYTFYKNKKITKYMLVSLIIQVVILFIPSAYNKLFFLNPYKGNLSFDEITDSVFMVSGIVVALVSCVINLCIIMYYSKAIYRVTDTRLIYGLLFKKTIDIKKIKKIRYNNDTINLFAPNKTVSLRLSMLKCNMEYTKSLLSFIKENLNNNVSIDEKSNDVINGGSIGLEYEKSNLKIDGWLLLLFLSIISSIYTQIRELFFLNNTEILTTSNTLFQTCGVCMILLTIVVIVIFAMKKGYAGIWIKAYIWFGLAYRVVKISSSSIAMTSQIYFIVVLMGIVGSVFYNLGIMEYLNSSDRVKNTFVR